MTAAVSSWPFKETTFLKKYVLSLSAWRRTISNSAMFAYRYFSEAPSGRIWLHRRLLSTLVENKYTRGVGRNTHSEIRTLAHRGARRAKRAPRSLSLAPTAPEAGRLLPCAQKNKLVVPNYPLCVSNEFYVCGHKKLCCFTKVNGA